MANVFISHASTDHEPTRRVRDLIRSGGHEVFLDKDPINGIPVGADWEKRLYERLRWADAVVCVVTSAYAESSWGNAEIGIARSRGCRVIPVLAEPGATHQLLPASLQYVDLARDESAARTSILHTLRLLDWHGGAGWPDERSPFPGLRAFSSADREVFFGRQRDIEALARELRMPAYDVERSLLLLVGPSGCGKSSLVQAGLLPTMASEPGWLTLPPIRPGREPTTALANRLATTARDLGLGWTLAEIRRRLDDGRLAELADELLLAAPEPHPWRLLLTVDQFEELVVQTHTDQRQRFAAVLRAGLAGPVHVVATLRPEFLDQILVNAQLADLPTRTRTIRPLLGDALPEVIEKPARIAGIEIEEGLVARLVEDTGGGEALPLLAFTLAELAIGVTRGDRLLISRYEQLGGVQGALVRQADAALRDAVTAGGRSSDAVLRELLRLVTVDEKNEPVRWWVPRAEISATGLVELDTFVAHRLVATDKVDSTALFGNQVPATDGGEGVDALGVAHEAFLTAWPQLRAAIGRESAALRARREVEQAARVWADARERGSKRAAKRLWEGGRLAAALTDLGAGDESSTETGGWRQRLRRPEPLVTGRIDLTGRAREFLQVSRIQDRRRRRRLVGFLSTMLVLALVAAGVAVHQGSIAQAQRDAAIHGQIASEADRLSSIDVSLAAQLDLLGYQLKPTPELRTALITMADTPLSMPLPGFRDSVSAVAYSPNGRVLVSGDDSGAVRLWDMADPNRPVQLGSDVAADPKWVRAVVFSPDGRVLATSGGEGTIKLWDIADPAKPVPLGGPLGGHSASVEDLAFSPDGRLLVSGSQDKTVRLWDVSNPATARGVGDPLAGHGKIVRTVALSPDGRVLASGGQDGTLRLWDLQDPARPTLIGQPLSVNQDFYVISVAFSPDGRVLASGSGDDTVRLWGVANPAAPVPLGQPLTGHTDFVNEVAFSPDGHMLATGSGDSTVRLWNVSDPATATPLGQPMNAQATVSTVAFSPDGRQLASGDQDPDVQLWSLPDLLRTDELGQVQKYTHAIRFTPDGRTIYRGSTDGSIRRWDASDPTRPVPMPERMLGHTSVASTVDISADGRLLASGSADRTVSLWDISDPARPTRFSGPFGEATDRIWTVAFSRDGRLLASGSADGTVRLWDISDPSYPALLGEPFTAHEDSVNAAVFSPDGRILITSSGDYSVRLWNIADPVHPVPAADPLKEHTLFVNDVVVSPNGRMLASGSADGTVRLWDITDPARVAPVGQPLDQGLPVFALSFSAGGTTLASGGADNAVWLWDLTDPAHVSQIGRPLRGHTDSISGLEFAPDGKTLLSGSRDRTVRAWDLDLERVIRRICTSIGSPLNEQNWPQVVSPDLPFREPCAGTVPAR